MSCCWLSSRKQNKQKKFPVSTLEKVKFPSAPLNFGERLRWLREKHSLTMAEFGARIGVGKGYISKLESGKSSKTSEQFIFLVCREFHVSRDWLLAGTGKPFSWDHLNELTEGSGAITLAPIVPLDEARTAFVDALFPAGITIQFSPTVESLAASLGNESARQMFRPAVRDEIKRILMDELAAKIAIRSKNKPKESSQTEAASELGKLAVNAVRYYKNLSERERTQIAIEGIGLKEQKQGLTDIALSGNITDVKAQLPGLLKRLNEATRERGTKAALAKFMGVKLPTVSRWLSGEKEPGGENALKLLHWVEQQERQK